ncbi:MAG TPA: AarF/ABC1/UbiB kinase family protein [Solirubrobacteraceae bacterium]|nr:AarF/ABC1/UbiB kinase family protein [Solirubrobacteraceae bacterium]
MAKDSGGERSAGEARMVALTQEFGAQLRRMGDAGAKITQLLSMVELHRVSQSDVPSSTLGTSPEERTPVPWRRLRGVIEQDLDARVQDVFADFEEKPFAIASLGQVHRACTRDGEQVAVKVQHPGVADSIAGDLRNVGLVTPILKRLAPGSDAGALLGEVRERITDELDYEIEAQHQRRLARLFRDHPHVVVPRVHTDLSTQRVLVTEYVDGLRFDELARLDETARDRIGEIVMRFFFGLVWREQIVAGDPHPDNCLLCQDGRVCLLDFGLLRGLDAEYLEGERDAMRAIVEADPDAVHDALGRLGYLVKSESYDPAGLLEHLATAGEWFLGQGFRRIDPVYVRRTLELGYPPRSPWLSVMRRLTLPPRTLLLRRMEVQMLSLLGELRAGGDWAAIAAEHWAEKPPSTPLGREDTAFFQRRSS